MAIIPARKGSKRLSGKNKKLLAGKELIRYVIEAAIQSKLINTVVVNSDDEAILQIAGEYSGIIPLRRPPKLATEKSKAIEYVHHTLEVLNEAYDFIVIVQPTSPFTIADDIDQTLQVLIESKADSAVSVVKLDHAIQPAKLKTLRGGRLHPYLEEEKGRMAEHELPHIYIRNGSVYTSTAECIKSGKIIGEDCRAYIMPRIRSIDINDQLDWEFAEFLAQKYN